MKELTHENEIKFLKKEIERLKWWENTEGLSLIQEELIELRNYKAMREKEDEKARKEEILKNSFGF